MSDAQHLPLDELVRRVREEQDAAIRDNHERAHRLAGRSPEIHAAELEDHPSLVCRHCGHNDYAHSPRSGLCGVEYCQCEGFCGSGGHQTHPVYDRREHLEEPHEGYCGVCHVETDGRPHHHGPRMSAESEVFVDHVVGLENALLFIRDTASERPESTDVIFTAAQAALCQWWDHKDTKESISVYAARMARQRDEALHQREIARRSRDDAENHAATAESENTHLSRERDVAVNALKQIVAEFDDADQDPVLHLARAALRQIAEPWMRADQSVRLP